MSQMSLFSLSRVMILVLGWGLVITIDATSFLTARVIGVLDDSIHDSAQVLGEAGNEPTRGKFVLPQVNLAPLPNKHGRSPSPSISKKPLVIHSLVDTYGNSRLRCAFVAFVVEGLTSWA